MRRLSPRQQGFGLLAFVIITATIAFSIVIGYAGVLTKSHANQLRQAQRTYLSEAREQVLEFYRENALTLDDATAAGALSADQLLDASNVRRRYAVQAAISNPLFLAGGQSYRKVALWIPAEGSAETPMDVARFEQNGEVVGCAAPGGDCPEWPVLIFDSGDLELKLQEETLKRMIRVAYKAQAYFKARMLQDPEKNISVNYFRPTIGCPGGNGVELVCMDVYTPLVSIFNGTAQLSATAMAIGIAEQDLLSAWGLPIEASNGLDAESTVPPFTMVFRARTPSGGYISIRALQPI